MLTGIFGSLFGATPEDGSKNVSPTQSSAIVTLVTQSEPSCDRGDRPYARGIASWYGPGFHGKLMANGKRYDMERYTVAHKTLPLGTHVCITNRANGQSVEATVTDRGPYTGKRIIDLSKRVADDLGITRAGLGSVDIFLSPQTTTHSISRCCFLFCGMKNTHFSVCVGDRSIDSEQCGDTLLQRGMSREITQ